MDIDQSTSIIVIPKYDKNRFTLHYGSDLKLDKFVNSYFQFDKRNAIIKSIEYKPDEFYMKNDGYFGNCWLVKLKFNDDENRFYSFRNFCDFVEYFNQLGYDFCDMSEK